MTDPTATEPPLTAEALNARVQEKRASLGLAAAGTTRTSSDQGQNPTSSQPHRPAICRRCNEAPARTVDVLGKAVSLGTCEACATAVQDEETRSLESRAAAGRRLELLRRRENIAGILKAAGVDVSAYGHATFGNFNPDPDAHALAACTEYAKRFVAGERPNIYLWSERAEEAIAPGSGKTFLAVATLRAIVTNDASIQDTEVRFLYVPRLFRQLQAAFGTSDDLIAKYARAEFLILDDIGLNNWTPWKIEVMADLLTERAGLSTFCTGNYTPGQMEAMSPSADFARIASRLNARSETVTLTGPDRR